MTKAKRIGPMLRLVLVAGALLQPLARPLLKRRLARGKEDPERWQEKLGQPSALRPDGTLVWLHGVGLGEVMALRGLIDALSRERPDLNFLVTSSARSSGEVFAKNLPTRTIHQYLPLDFPTPVRTFLDHWKPDLAVWSDQEVWPRLAVTCAHRAIPQAYVAARLTDDSAKARARFGEAYGNLYRLLDARHAQEQTTAQHLAELMGDDTPVAVSGSLKAAAAPLAAEPDRLSQMQGLCEGRRVWVLASAQSGEEAIAIEAHLALLRCDPSALLIIAHRVPNQGIILQKAMADDGITASLRSTGALPDAGTSFYIADTLGELGLWYRLADVALIGGTFSDVEGHNPWEAVALNCAVAHGRRVANFAADYRTLDRADAARLVDTPTDLLAMLTDPETPDTAARASAVRSEAAVGLAQIRDALLGFLDR